MKYIYSTMSNYIIPITIINNISLKIFERVFPLIRHCVKVIKYCQITFIYSLLSPLSLLSPIIRGSLERANLVFLIKFFYREQRTDRDAQ